MIDYDHGKDNSDDDDNDDDNEDGDDNRVILMMMTDANNRRINRLKKKTDHTSFWLRLREELGGHCEAHYPFPLVAIWRSLQDGQ